MNDSRIPLPPLNRISRDVLCARDYEPLAQRFMTAQNYAYIAGGSAQELTLEANREALERTFLHPRLLRDMRGGNTRFELFGRLWPHPILLAPVAFQELVHPLGELETARAAAATDSCLVASTLATRTMEQIAQHAGRERWFQLYIQPTRNATVNLIKRAEMAGYSALVITLDASIKTPSLRAERAGFAMPPEIVAASLTDYPAPSRVVLNSGQSIVFDGVMAEAPTWDDLSWLMTQTRLPVLIKGVLHPQDARRLQDMGVAGIVVSNHGGRALDGVPASLAVLPQIRAALGDDFPILFDSGIRSGSDIFKALALGANAVMIGRLQVYALAVGGALGVAHMLRLLREELEICMAQAGCATLAEIGPDMIYR